MLADLGCYSLDYIVHVIVEAKCKLRIIKFNVKSLLKSDDELNDGNGIHAIFGGEFCSHVQLFNKIIQSVQKYLCIFVLNVKITVKYMV